MRQNIAVITARGGSKGLKGKNIKPLSNKPLIAWTIEAALQAESIDRTIVDTDCKKIADIAVNYGAEVPFLRPAKLATDSASTSEVMLHLIDKMGFESEIIVLLQPTSPLRTHLHIDEAYEIFQRGDSETLISITPLDKSPLWSFWIDDHRLRSVFEDQSSLRRQDLRQAYAPNGAIYIFNVDSFKINKKFILHDSMFYLMKKNESIDIDDLFDFKMAEILMEEK